MKNRSKYPFLNQDYFMGFAHRGAATGLTENTLQAFRAAHLLGYKNFELDVRASLDGEVFICHDDSLERILGEPLLLSKLSSNKIKELERTNGFEITKLETILEEFPNVNLNIDAKSWKVIGPLCKIIEQTNCHDRICIASFNDLRILKIIRRLGPRVCYSLGPVGVINCYMAYLLKRKIRVQAGCLQIPDTFYNYEYLTEKFIEFVHRLGLLIHIWTVNNESRMRKLIDIGVDGIMTDNCSGLKNVMKEYQLWRH